MVSQRRAESICRLEAILVIQAFPKTYWCVIPAGMVELSTTACRGAEHFQMAIGLAKQEQSGKAKPEMLASLRARLDCRNGMASSTAGVANGFVQGNLAILPEKLAASFHRFCQVNPKPCPIIGMSDVGNPHIPSLGVDLDIRTDLPRYRIWRDGEVIEEPTDIMAHWRDDLVAFVIGCSFSFEEALLADDIPIRPIERGVRVPY